MKYLNSHLCRTGAFLASYITFYLVYISQDYISPFSWFYISSEAEMHYNSHILIHLGIYFVILLILESDEVDYLQDNMNLYPTTRARIQYLMFPLLSCQCLLGIDV